MADIFSQRASLNKQDIFSRRAHELATVQLPASEGQEEGLGSSILRTVAAIPTRVIQGAVSAPGDVLQTAGIPSQLMGREGYQDVQNEMPASFPTSEQSQRWIDEKTGGYLKPKGNVEETIQNIASDIGGALPWILTGPVGGAMGTIKALAKYLPSAIGGNVAQQTVKNMGGSAIAQTVAKLGGGIGSGMLGTKNQLVRTKDKAYRVAEDIASKGHLQNSTALENSLSKLREQAKRENPVKPDIAEKVIQSVNELADKGKIRVKEAWEMKKALNKQIYKRDIDADLKPYLHKLVTHINEDVLQPFGRRNKEFGKHFNIGEDIHRGLNNASRFTSFMNRNTTIEGLAKKNPVIRKFLLVGSTGGLGMSAFKLGTLGTGLGAGAVGAGAIGVRQLSRFRDLLKTSKTARSAYADAFEQAVKHNTPGFMQAVSKLDKML